MQAVLIDVGYFRHKRIDMKCLLTSIVSFTYKGISNTYKE